MAKKTEDLDQELFFRALADRTRLRLINLMGNDEVCVCFFVDALKTNQPKISRHLAYLRRAGIVEARREGTWMHYRVATPKDPDAAQVLADIRAWLTKDANMKQERKFLAQLCCLPASPVTISSPRKRTSTK